MIDEDGVLLSETFAIEGNPRIASLVNIDTEERGAAPLPLPPRHLDSAADLMLIQEF